MLTRPRPTTPPQRPAGRRLTHIGTLLPLAIGLANGAATRGTVPTPSDPPAITRVEDAESAICEDVLDVDDCHTRYPTGCNSNGQYDPGLNFLKDRADFSVTAVPKKYLTPSDFEKLEAALPDGLKTRNHLDFATELRTLGEGQEYGLIGYLYPSKTEGKESSNCGLDDADAVDFHLYIGFDADTAQQLRAGKKFTGEAKKALNRESVIVEMTPHYRSTFHPSWNFDDINGFVGRQVKVVGQLMVDNEHNLPSQNCGRPDAKVATCWRLSVWELHPVTQFFVCGTDSCSQTSDKWQTLEQIASAKPSD